MNQQARNPRPQRDVQLFLAAAQFARVWQKTPRLLPRYHDHAHDSALAVLWEAVDGMPAQPGEHL